jgi:hypothetical protein
MGLEQARIAKIERNPGSVSLDQLILLLNALDTTVFIRQKEKTPMPSAKAKVGW